MAGVLGCAYMLLNQITTRRQEMLADTAHKRQVLISINKATSGIEDLNQKIDDLKRAITFFESKLPEEKEVNAILDQVSRMADVNSLQSKSVKTLRSTKAAGYSEQPIEISLSGDFYGFYAFLLQLENLPLITRITKMDLTKIDDHDGEMQSKVTLSIFFEPDTAGGSGAVAASR
jgi:type IV pilus assembly protein PilO